MKISLNTWILIGAAFGVLFGSILNVIGPASPFAQSALYFCDIAGNLFVNLLKMILIPLVFTSITVGIANLRAHAQMNRVWQYALLYFVMTSAFAVLLGLIVVNIFKPGVGLQVDMFADAMVNFKASDMTVSEFTKTFLNNLFLNPFQAMAEGNVLPTVLFALFLGIALISAGDSRAKTLLSFFSEFFDIIMLMVSWIMVIAPIGIAGLLAKLVATQNPQLLMSLGKFMAVAIGATLFHGFVTLPVLLFALTGMSPAKFFSGIKEAMVTAFSTASSSATLPVTMSCVEEKLGVNKDIGGFVLPLGATINMDGTALYEAVAAIFVANIAGVELTLAQQVIVFMTSIIAAMGAPGIPSAGMVTMIMVLQSVGLPVEAIAILLPVDRALDAVRTMINVEGDCVGCVVVEKAVSART